MNEYLFPGNSSSFEPEDSAIVKATDTLDIVRHIIADTDASTVLSHLGWWMLQVYAPIADNHFFVQKYGSKETAELLRPLFCETQVETSFQASAPRQTHGRQLSKSPDPAHLRTPQQRAPGRRGRVRKVGPAGLKPRRCLTRKLKLLRVNLWPRPEYRSAALLRRIYSFKYASKKTMLDYWISERRGNAALIGGSAYFEDKRLPHGNSKDPFSLRQLLGHRQLVDGRGARAVLLPRRRGVWGDQLRRPGRGLREDPPGRPSTPRCALPSLVMLRVTRPTETRAYPGALRSATMLRARKGWNSVWSHQSFCRHSARSRRRRVVPAPLTRADSHRRKCSSSTSVTVRRAWRPASTATPRCEERPILFPAFRCKRGSNMNP
ncbi:hypothetical protein MTO96_049337 [Rhipicephalus appendiculatus]